MSRINAKAIIFERGEKVSREKSSERNPTRDAQSG